MPSSTIVFFGYGPHAVAGIDTLASLGAGPALIVVPSNRSGDDVDSVVAHAGTLGIPVLSQPANNKRTAFVNRVRALEPDVLIVWSYSMLLPQDLLDLPQHGTVNVHTGVLPEYRGGHVLQWALINGEAETGVTLHYLDAAVDTGPIIGAARFPIAAEDDAVSLKLKLQDTGTALLRTWWPQIVAGTAPRIAQDESRARYWPLRRVEEGRIDLTKPAAEIGRLIRALNANDPGAYIDVGGRRVSITRATVLPPPGGSGWRLTAADGDILVIEASIGGRRLDASEMLSLSERVPNSPSDR